MTLETAAAGAALVGVAPRAAAVPAARRIPLTTPAVIEIQDDPLPGGHCNRMSITVWIGENSTVPPGAVARALAIGFMERTLEALRRSPIGSFDAAWPQAQ